MHEYLIKQFKYERRRQGISQETVADNSMASLSAVSKIEINKREPRLGTFMDMCKAIGYMVVIVPIPEELRMELKIREPEVIVPDPVDYDNWDETKPQEP